MTVKINADTSDGLKLTSDTSGEIDLQTNGTTKVHMDSSGNVGIGTTSPSGALQIGGTDSILISGEGTGDRDFSTNTFSTIDIPSFSLMNQVGATYKNISGLGMNFTNGVLGIVSNYQYTGGGKIAFYTGDKTSTTGNLTEAMRIDSSGDVLVATTSNISSSGGPFQVKSRSGSEHVASFQNGISDGGWGIPFFNTSGSEVGSIRWTASVTNYNTSSDYRLKENVNYTFDATTEVKRLRPCKFNFIGESETVEGFLAHEVSDVVPLAVTGTKDATDSNNSPIYQSIDQSKLVPLLVKTIQELEARITALENN